MKCRHEKMPYEKMPRIWQSNTLQGKETAAEYDEYKDD